ncbi:APC family permease [Granulicella sibirica]|uniref:Amino acid permease n=1 Tax=Granulicella sibirica TaxID=2479048 RepID=A0A4V1L653_9BACT|nr:APC family permease [Granulicella sibirica]RXH58064.1 Amino acid permease [Granulicella sibirica]
MEPVSVAIHEKAAAPVPESYRLKQQILSPLETLAQSVSTIAPSTSPTLTIPLVFALAGTGTWLAYTFALIAMTLVGLCIAAFARDSASPGSLYVYTKQTLPPIFATISAWSLFFAYVTTASSVIGGFIAYAYVVLGRYGHLFSPVLLAAIATAACIFIAYRDIQVSTRLMLWIEGASVCLIAIVAVIVLSQHGLHLDPTQIHLTGSTPVGLRLGVMLAIFSFVGFESATTLGAEAKAPLTTIPQAVIRSAVFSGIFFIICAYTLVLGFHVVSIPLNESAAPFRILAAQAHITPVGRVIDVGVLVSMFAATLSCIIAGARVLMLMAHHGFVHASLGKTHATHDTPGTAGLLTGFLAFIPAAVLAHRGVSGNDIYGYMGSTAVFGFLTCYGLVAVALPVHLKRQDRLNGGWLLLAIASTAAMLLAMVGTIYPIPPAPYRYLPYVYLAYLLCGLGWYAVVSRRRAA